MSVVVLKRSHVEAKVKVKCFSLISISVIKYPDRNSYKEKDLFGL